MISYKKVAKFKYTKNPTDVVSLREYILFEDSMHENKHALLKFRNNLDQKLFGVQFEVFQYDESDNLIAKSLVVYDKFTAEANSEFVPKAKLRLSINCASISLRLISADFDRIRWEKGEFTDNSYKFKRYVAEANKQPAPRGERPVVAAADTQPKVSNGKKKVVAFEMRDVYAKNMAKFPRVFNILAAIILIAFVVATVIWFTRTSARKTVDNYDVRINGGLVSVYGYEGDEKDLVIPATIGGYPVARIEKGAFGKASGIVSVTFVSGVTVCEGAFNGCPDLVAVISDQNVKVLGGGFTGCEKLSIVDMPNATVTKESFLRSFAVSSFNVDSSDAEQIAAVFGAYNNMRFELGIKLPGGRITTDYFDGVIITDLRPKGAYFADFAALANVEMVDGVRRLSYTYFDDLEVKAGSVEDVRPGCNILTVPDDVKIFDADRFASRLSSVRTLVLESGFKADEDFFAAFPNLSRVEIKNAAAVKKGAFAKCSATQLVAPVLEGKLADYTSGSNLLEVTVSGGALDYSASDYFEGVNLIALRMTPEVTVSVNTVSLQNVSVRTLTLQMFRDGALTELYASLAYVNGLGALGVVSGKCTQVGEKTFDGLGHIKSLSVECNSMANGSLSMYDQLDSLTLKLTKYGDSFSKLFGATPDSAEFRRITVGKLVLDTSRVSKTYFDDCGACGIKYILM